MQLDDFDFVLLVHLFDETLEQISSSIVLSLEVIGTCMLNYILYPDDYYSL